MSRCVTLYDLDGSTALGNVLLASDYPSDPSVLVWDASIFFAGSIVYGSGSPGNYESYIKHSGPTLTDKEVAAPDKVPTVVV